jgi:hypothetical protein
MAPVFRLTDESDSESKALLDLARNAREYLQSFAWCTPIREVRLAFGIAGVLGLFLVEFDKKIQGTDDRLWVVSGDLPQAYFVVEPNDTAQVALERYCSLMDGWIFSVLSFGDFDEVYPVKAQRTAANADQLRRRIDFIRSEIVPNAPDESIDSR